MEYGIINTYRWQGTRLSARKKKWRYNLLKKIIVLFLIIVLVLSFALFTVSAATYHTVVKGDTMWRIATKYEVGLSEIKAANPEIKNPDLIYPGQVLTVPTVNEKADSCEREVVRLVNAERKRMGLSELKYNWQLSRVARYKSEDMRDKGYFSHTSPTYGSPYQMMKSFGITYRTAGENIAKGQTSPEAVVKGWMNSSGHRANILNPSFTEIGVGFASGNYWTQMFIG